MNIYQPNFCVNKEKPWRAFLRRINASIDISFTEVIQEISVFLLPIHNSCVNHTSFHRQWDTIAWK